MKKYDELKEELINLINSGEACSTNGRFMSERSISEMFNVSRTTVRKAISDLQKEGYLMSIHGKGTFMKTKESSQSIYSVIRCTQNYMEMGLHPSMKVLRKEIIPASEGVAKNLKISKGDPVLLLDKLFYGNRILFNETIAFIPITRFPKVQYLDFSNVPIVEILRSKFGAHARRTENSVEAILPTNDIMENLKITKTTPLILFESVTYGSYNGQYVPFEYFKCYYKTDRMRFSFTQDHDALY